MIAAGLPKVDQQPVRSAPRFAKKDTTGSKYVKEQESQLLNFFTQEASFKIGGGIVLGLLVLFAIVGAP